VIDAGGIPRSHAVEGDLGNIRFGNWQELGHDGPRFQQPLSLESKLLAIEFEEKRVLADKVLGKDGGGEYIESLLFDGLEKAGRDFELLGDLRQLEIAPEALAAEGVADRGHRETIRVSESIILRGILRPGVVTRELLRI